MTTTRSAAAARALLITAAAGVILAGGPHKVAAAETSRCPAATSADRIASVRQDGTVELSSGRIAKLADIRLPERDGPGLAWLRSLAGEAVQVDALGPPDRWARIPAELRTADAAPIAFAELLVGEGLAAVDAGERNALCRSDLLALERAARHRAVGIWSGTGWPIAASDRDALAKATGAFAIVEGRVVSVGERRERTYLNFGRDWSRDFSVTIPKRVWAALIQKGTTARALTNTTVRVRGIVEMRRAPTLEIVVPDLLEVADDSRDAPGRK